MKPGIRLDGMRVLLVDDVLTTGATASACARVLKRAGARQVTLLAVARTDRRAFLSYEFKAAARAATGTGMIAKDGDRLPRHQLYRPVLVLNASYEPINICAARRALVLVLKGVARPRSIAHVAVHSRAPLHARAVASSACSNTAAFRTRRARSRARTF